MYNEKHDKNITSKLKLINLYVAKSDFERKLEIKSKDLDIKINHFIKECDDIKKYEIRLVLTISNNDDSLKLKVEMVGVFVSDDKNLIKENAISIMFPYIRSYVSTLTTQPDLLPIVLQPINVLSLLN